MVTAVNALTLLLILIKLLLRLNLTLELRLNPGLWGTAEATTTLLSHQSVIDQLVIICLCVFSWFLVVQAQTQTVFLLFTEAFFFSTPAAVVCQHAPPTHTHNYIYSSPPPHLSHPLLRDSEGGTQHI